MAKFIHEGRRVDYTPESAVAAGDVVVVGDLIGVATQPIAASALGSLAVEGVFAFPKATGEGTALTQGTKVYWDADNSQVVTTGNDHKQLGFVTKAAADADETVQVKIDRGEALPAAA